jgi:hypothetical protein
MSLQNCPVCKKQNSYWRIYKEINLKHFSKWMSVKCDYCKEKMKIKIKDKSPIEMMKSWFLWMAFPILLILFVAFEIMDYKVAIFHVIVYHFLAMYIIIKTFDYKK